MKEIWIIITILRESSVEIDKDKSDLFGKSVHFLRKKLLNMDIVLAFKIRYRRKAAVIVLRGSQADV